MAIFIDKSGYADARRQEIRYSIGAVKEKIYPMVVALEKTSDSSKQIFWFRSELEYSGH